MDYNKLQFFIVPANMPPHFENRNLHNHSYNHYKNSWERILNRPGRESLFKPDEFLRQDYVFQVMNGEEVVCQILGTHYHLESTLTYDLSYFQNFKSDALAVLQSENIKKLMSLEYSSIKREYSPKYVDGINFGEVITYLGIEYAKHLGVEVILGMPRRVTGTNERVVNSGFRRVKSNLSKCNVTVDVTLGFINEIIEHPDRKTQFLISKLWNERNDLLGYSKNDLAKNFNYYGKNINKQMSFERDEPILQEAL